MAVTNLSLLTLVENTSMRHGLFAQHGQSLLITYNDKKYLFDTGEIYAGFVHNLRKLNIDMSTIDGVIISHRHLDHCGALPEMLKLLSKQKIYITPDTLVPVEDNKDIYGFNQVQIDILRNYPHLEVVEKPLELEPGLWLTGPLAGKVYEQSIVVDCKERGLAVIVGCSHPGLEAIISRAVKVTGNSQMYGIIGGFHYKDSDENDLEKYIGFLQKLNPDFIIPSHCTGFKAITLMQNVMPTKVHVSSTGSLGVGNNFTLLPDFEFESI